VPDWDAVPPALFDLLVRALFTDAEFFVRRGEAERAAAFLERAVISILEIVESDRPVAFRRALAQPLVFHGRFLMAYFSERNLRALYRARARIIEFYLATAGHAVDMPIPPRPADQARVRVGVLRQGWVVGAETAATLAHVQRLDRERFELIFYSLISGADPVEQVARARSERFTVLNGNSVAEAVRRIRDDRLDVLLVANNVTAVNHLLAFVAAFRLAPVQVALTLNPATTGFRHMDVFLNGAFNEPAEAQADYTERLCLVPGSINHYDFTGEPVPGGAVGLPPGLERRAVEFLFASGANFYKLVPELLECWARILLAVPEGRLVLYPFNPNWTNLYPVDLFSRHVRGLFGQQGVDPARVLILRPMPNRAHIHALLRQINLYLDSFPFSGAVSVLDPAVSACPMVIRAGRSARHRQSVGMHEEARLGAVVTDSAEAYEAAAIRLARDSAALADLKVRALEARERVRGMVSLDLGPLLLDLVGERFPRS